MKFRLYKTIEYLSTKIMLNRFLKLTNAALRTKVEHSKIDYSIKTLHKTLTY